MIALKKSVDVRLVIPSQSAFIENAVFGGEFQYVTDPIHPVSSVRILVSLCKQKQGLN
jgi:hypothetical protein